MPATTASALRQRSVARMARSCRFRGTSWQWYRHPAPERYCVLRLDGVYVLHPDGGLRFRRVKAPEREELEVLVQRIAERVVRAMERIGLLQRDAESAWLDLPLVENEVL